ncbi:MAG: hypothetical protein L6R41_006896, partial [Letrouitia leprolyta]
MREDQAVGQREFDDFNAVVQAQSTYVFGSSGPRSLRIATRSVLEAQIRHLEATTAEVERIMDHFLQHALPITSTQS